MKYALFLFIFFYSFPAFAQKETNNWVFGRYAGVSWNTGVPVAFSGSQMDQLEGTSSISDANGQLLFYTNGIKVWNRNHSVMPNGTGLMGHNSDTQVLIAQRPGSQNIYYIFTTGVLSVTPGTQDMRYSIVDMSQDSGRGDVTTKNILLFAPSCEKVTAVHHSDNKRIWVVAHKLNSRSFYAYRVDSTGISAPVITNTGTTQIDGSGYIKISPNGKKLALVSQHDFTGWIEYFDFNTQTGVISNGIIDSSFTPNAVPWGIEFSPNSRFVYANAILFDTACLFQCDLQTWNAAAVIASKVVLATKSYETFDALQLAPDNKIYLTEWLDPYLAVINNPDVKGLGCSFQSQTVQLSPGAKSRIGLPNFIQSYFYHPNYFNFQNTCFNNPTSFVIENYEADSVFWNFGDVASGLANTSNQLNPSHVFSSKDTFNVTLLAYHDTLCDTSIKQVIVSDSLGVIISGDTIVCSGTMVSICAPAGFANYVWNIGSASTNCINVSGAGNYYVSVTDNSGCIAESNYVAVGFYPGSSVSISVNGDTLNAYGAVSYQWYLNGNIIIGAISNIYVANQAGSYTVAITDSNGCNATSLTIVVSAVEKLAKAQISISPNPFTTNLSIILHKENLQQATFIITNIIGQPVYTKHENNLNDNLSKILDLGYLPAGLYFLEVIADGERVVKQLVKQ